MRRKSAFTHLRVILIIDIIVIAMAASGYFYIQSFSGLTVKNFKFTGFVSNSSAVFEGDPMSVSINVTNISNNLGNCTINLLVDDNLTDTKIIQLGAAETEAVPFVFTATEGKHSIQIGDFQSFVNFLSKYTVSDLAVNRTLAGLGEKLGITFRVANIGQNRGTYDAVLTVNGTIIDAQKLQVEAGSSTAGLFVLSESIEGTYLAKVGNATAAFVISASAPPPKPASFDFSQLTIDPLLADILGNVRITVHVTNTGEIGGTQSVSLIINSVQVSTRTISLSGAESTTLQFSVTETIGGTYIVSVGGLSGSFQVKSTQALFLSSMTVSPNEVWPGQQITITVQASNSGSKDTDLPVNLIVDGQVSDNQTVHLPAGESALIVFTLTAQSEGTHSLNVNGIIGNYVVVKSGYHTLIVNVSPSASATFTLTAPDGTSQQQTTYYSTVLPEATYIIEFPWSDPDNAAVTFLKWEDGGANPVRTISLTSRTSVTAYYTGGTGGSSCPSLYEWNGTEYIYASEVSNHGWLGYINCVNNDGSVTFYRNNPWDYIPLDRTQLQPTNGYYNLTLMQRWNEVFYLDKAYMQIVDHPANVSVYSTMVEQYLDPNYMGNIYTVSSDLLTPASAVNENGQNVLPQISKIDGVFTNGTNGIQSPTWNSISWNRITMNLGNLNFAQQIKLVVRAVVDWGSPDDYATWLNKFFDLTGPNGTLPNGTQVTPPPYMEVKDAAGNWVRVPESREFPLPPDGVPRTYVIDLTGLFPTNDFTLRISNFWNVTFDYISIDTSPQQNITVQRVDSQAYLYGAFPTGIGAATGNFTKYGNVSQLLLNQDDLFVIGRQGDGVSLQFPIGNMAAPAPGMVRDYFLYEACWFKDQNGNWGFGFGFTVDPLPFQNMSGFPYPPNESYPNDTSHSNYLQEWNTRVINETANT
jgi:hypothetical protein